MVANCAVGYMRPFGALGLPLLTPLVVIPLGTASPQQATIGPPVS
jgi:hypothetical protein